MKEKYTLKVYPAGAGKEVYRVMEMTGEYTLDDLCAAILESFDFIHEHMYEFCMDNRMYSKCSYQAYPETDEEPSTQIELDQMGLVEKQKFSLHYDFGDDWMFTITVQKITDVTESVAPRVIKQKGFVEQYPGWDEEEDEEDYESSQYPGCHYIDRYDYYIHLERGLDGAIIGKTAAGKDEI